MNLADASSLAVLDTAGATPGTGMPARLRTDAGDVVHVGAGAASLVIELPLSMPGTPGMTVRPAGNAADTLAAVSVQGTTVNANLRQFMEVTSLTANAGGACTGLQCGAVTSYRSVVQMPGASDAWVDNILLTAEAGVDKYAQAVEVDVNNLRGDTPLGRGNFVGGITLTGTNAQTGYLNRQALMVSSGQNRALWHVGLLGEAHSVKDALIFDQATGATYSYWNQTSHAGALIFDQGASPIGAALSGGYARAAIATDNARTPNALIAAEGQRVCFAGTDACISHASGKLTYIVGGVPTMSVSDGGNMTIKGTLTQGGSP